MDDNEIRGRFALITKMLKKIDDDVMEAWEAVVELENDIMKEG